MEKYKSKFDKLVPNKLFWSFDLHQGCRIIGIVLSIVMAACVIATVVQTLGLKECDDCAFNSWKHAYSYSISACIYCCLMFLVNLWFLWGVSKEKKSVVMSWVVISAVWLSQTTCLLIVLIVEYFSEVSLTMWLLGLAFTIIVVLILAYFILVAYGYWIQLRDRAIIPIPEVPKIVD